jgi:hypothetical protein
MPIEIARRHACGRVCDRAWHYSASGFTLVSDRSQAISSSRSNRHPVPGGRGQFGDIGAVPDRWVVVDRSPDAHE